LDLAVKLKVARQEEIEVMVVGVATVGAWVRADLAAPEGIILSEVEAVL
jgi:hypothetical protein